MKKLFIIATMLAFVACGDGNKSNGNDKHPNNAGNTDEPVNSVDSVEDHHGANDDLHDNDDSVPATPPGERTPR